MKNILKFEGFFNRGESKTSEKGSLRERWAPFLSKKDSNKRQKIASHKLNIRNIVDENNALHRRSVNGIIAVVKEQGSESIQLPYEIPYKSDPIVSVDKHGFAYTKDDKHLDLMGFPIIKLIEIYEALVSIKLEKFNESNSGWKEEILDYFQDFIDGDIEVDYDDDFNGGGDDCLEICVPINLNENIIEDWVLETLKDLKFLVDQSKKLEFHKKYKFAKEIQEHNLLRGFSIESIDWNQISDKVRGIISMIEDISQKKFIKATLSEGYKKHHDYVIRIVFD